MHVVSCQPNGQLTDAAKEARIEKPTNTTGSASEEQSTYSLLCPQ